MAAINNLTSGPVAKQLFKLTIPMIFGIFSLMAFNLVDTFFVSLLGTEELAAISFTFPVVLFVGSISMGLGTAASSVISRAIGNQDFRKVKRLTTDSLFLSLLIVALFVYIGFRTIEPTFRLLGATGNVLVLVKEYMNIWYIGMVFLVIPMVGNNALRASGDTRTPGMIMVVAAVINIILDPLLIFGLAGFPRLGLAGAALATVIARSFSMVFSLTILHYRKKMLDFSRPKFKDMLESWKKILYIGIPSAASNMLLPLSTAIIMFLAAKFGIEVAAAVGVGIKIEAFAIMVIMAVTAVLVPFIGQNLGAKKFDRICRAQKYCNYFSLFWGLGCAIVFFIIARPLSKVFSNEPVVIKYIIEYLWIMPLGYGLRGSRMLAIAIFNALNKPFISVAINTIWIFVLFIPLSYLGTVFFGVEGILFGVTVSQVIAGIICLYLVDKECKNKLKS